jgi:hypothetical protein
MPADDRPWETGGYALPYYTRSRGDTEILIGNPGPDRVRGWAYFFGPECRVVAETVALDIFPHCTQSIRARAIVPDFAGHAILAVERRLAVSLLFERRDAAVVANSVVDGNRPITWPTRRMHKTYGFAYRTRPSGNDTLEASLFVSNPNSAALGGALTVYDERCEPTIREQFTIGPDCTDEFALPPGHVGYAEIRVGVPAVLHLVHRTATSKGLAASELLGAGNEIA